MQEKKTGNRDSLFPEKKNWPNKISLSGRFPFKKEYLFADHFQKILCSFGSMVSLSSEDFYVTYCISLLRIKAVRRKFPCRFLEEDVKPILSIFLKISAYKGRIL